MKKTTGKKTTGNYTTDAGKSLKNSDRLQCRIDDDGAIYLCNGYVIYRMTPAEYAATVQPVTRCDAGNWIIDRNNNHKREAGPNDSDVVKMFLDTVNAQGENTLEKCLAEFPLTDKITMVSYYSAAADFAAFFDRRYMGALAPGLTVKTTTPLSPAVVFDRDEAVAIVCPVKPKDDAVRAVKAYFAEQSPDDKHREKLARISENKIENLRRQIAAKTAEAEKLQEKIAEQAADIEKLQAELTAAQTAEQAAPVEQPAPVDTKTAAQVIASRFAGMDGVQVTIKGEKTAAPVVWLAGDTEKHADAIRAAGAKWSGKRGAYYVRVA